MICMRISDITTHTHTNTQSEHSQSVSNVNIIYDMEAT